MAKSKPVSTDDETATPPVDAEASRPPAMGRPEVVKRPRANAGPCPAHPNHTATRVYTTRGVTRYCVCDDCGHTWKVTGERADPDKQYLAELAEALDRADVVRTSGSDVVCLEVKLCKEIVTRLRAIANR